MRRAVIIGGLPLLLRSNGVAGGNEAIWSSRRRPCNFACMARGRGCTGSLFTGKSITHKEESQAAGVSTAAFGRCTMEWQWIIAGAALLPG